MDRGDRRGVRLFLPIRKTAKWSDFWDGRRDKRYQRRIKLGKGDQGKLEGIETDLFENEFLFFFKKTAGKAAIISYDVAEI